jgi:carbonic anhydrase
LHAEPPAPRFPTPLTAGYRRFRANRFVADAARYRRLADQGQRPSAMVIACSDSRSAPETIFDAAPGELFVVRNIAALVPPCAPDGRHHATSAALEFAVLALGVRAIVVLGHARCGGIAAVVGQTAPLSRDDFVGAWMGDVRELAAAAREREPNGSDVSARQTELERAVVARSLVHLRTFPWIGDREAAGDLVLHGAWFDIGPGALYVLGPAGRWDPFSVT